MPTPTPVTDPFIACVGLSATVGGQAVSIMTGGFSATPDTDDMTSTTGGGYAEDVVTIKKASFKLTIASKGGLTGLVPGLIYEVLINTLTPAPTGGVITPPTPVTAGAPAFCGNVRLMLDDAPILDVKKGVQYSFSGNSQGQYGLVI